MNIYIYIYIIAVLQAMELYTFYVLGINKNTYGKQSFPIQATYAHFARD